MKDFLPHKLPDDNNPITIDELSANYIQEADCWQPSNEYQQLKISTADGGGGVYFVIETKRWAFNNINELIKTLEDFVNRTNELNERQKLKK